MNNYRTVQSCPNCKHVNDHSGYDDEFYTCKNQSIPGEFYAWGDKEVGHDNLCDLYEAE